MLSLLNSFLSSESFTAKESLWKKKLLKNMKSSWALVAHTSNPSYLGG
jgi:hypothetical protein